MEEVKEENKPMDKKNIVIGLLVVLVITLTILTCVFGIQGKDFNIAYIDGVPYAISSYQIKGDYIKLVDATQNKNIMYVNKSIVIFTNNETLYNQLKDKSFF